ncbi:MAG: transglycosylase domain-containing protein [Candidatus Taylorbacteria bacterium]|nr:transglycosylase domain-containing protein [Candidatus Taylorbacteria bacterium]
MRPKEVLHHIRDKTLAVWGKISQAPGFIVHHPFKTVKICSRTAARTMVRIVRTAIYFVLACYFFAYFFPLPLDYLVWTAHFVFFGSSNHPNLEKFIKYEEPAIGEIYDSQGKVVIKLAQEYRRINQYSDFPKIVVGAVLSTEDRRFFGHNGIDYWTLFTSVPWDVVGASWKATSKHRPYFIPTLVMSRGGSTLTQQAVRLHLLSEITKIEKSEHLIIDNWRTRILVSLPRIETNHVNTILRKIRELLYSIYTENEFRKIYSSKQKAKEEIFARYASSVYLGSVYGIGYGTEHYFGKNLEQFGKEDVPEAALLAGMIKYPLPSTFSIKREIPSKYLARKNEILRLMAVNGYITDKEMEEFIKKEIGFAPLEKKKTTAPSVVDNVLKEVRGRGFSSDDLFKGFIHVSSTVDLRIQNIANEACEDGLKAYEIRHPENTGEAQCSVVILRNKDAAILAEVGGRQWYKGRQYSYSDLNRVNRARQAGSAFKPFDYLTAYMNGWQPTDIILDAPIGVNMGYGRGVKFISNYDGKFIGPASLETMLRMSRNAPTIRLVMLLGDGQKSGIEKVAETVKLLGIESELHNDTDHRGRKVYYITSALGASEMNVVELANAYREIASGLNAKPYMIEKIIGRAGEPLFVKENKTELSEIDPMYLAMIRSGLRKIVTQPGSTAYSLTAENFPVPVMGKTGTTNDFRNALFAGSTYGPNGITVVARVDFDDNRELGSGETGARTALPIFKYIMLNIYKEKLTGPAPQFPEETEDTAHNPAAN